MGLKRPICVLGLIKRTNLVGEHAVYPLNNSEKFTPYKMAYWLIQKRDDSLYDILNVLYV